MVFILKNYLTNILPLFFWCCMVAKYLIYNFTFTFHTFYCEINNRECWTTVHFVPQQVYLGYGRLFILSSTNIKWQRNLSEIFGCGYNEREINLKYLDADKMRGKVQNSECRTSHWNFAIVQCESRKISNFWNCVCLFVCHILSVLNL